MFGRFVDDNFNIKQRLMSFRTAQSSMNAIQIAFVLLETLNSAGVSPSKVLGTNRDGAAVNGLAITHFQEAKPDVKFWNLKCLAHFLNLVGERISKSLGRKFLSDWKALFSKRPKTKALWKSITGCSWISTCPTRWWSEWDQVNQICLYYPQVLKLFKHPEAPDCCKEMASGSLRVFLRFSNPFFL